MAEVKSAYIISLSPLIIWLSNIRICLISATIKPSLCPNLITRKSQSTPTGPRKTKNQENSHRNSNNKKKKLKRQISRILSLLRPSKEKNQTLRNPRFYTFSMSKLSGKRFFGQKKAARTIQFSSTSILRLSSSVFSEKRHSWMSCQRRMLDILKSLISDHLHLSLFQSFATRLTKSQPFQKSCFRLYTRVQFWKGSWRAVASCTPNCRW